MDCTIDVKEKNGLRTLHFGSPWIQGAMQVDAPWALALEYTRTMMACLLLREAQQFPRRVLLIGLGAGALAKFLYRHCPAAHLTVVELEPEVVEVARASFHVPPDDARLEIVISEGADYVRNTQQVFDLIMVDGFNERGYTGELNTQPFYELCRTRLDEQGMLVANLVGISHGCKGGFAYIEAAFAQRGLMLPRCKSGNTIAVGVTGAPVDLDMAHLAQRATDLLRHTGLDLQPLAHRLAESYPDRLQI